MKIARLGEFGKEKPAVIVNESEAVFVDDVISDWNRTELEKDRKSTRLNSSHSQQSRMPSSA